jgi:hypothetical protein
VAIRHRFERPQKGNPHQLPVNQHVWPLKSIARFAGGTAGVWLFDKVRNKVRQAKPADDLFCAKRVWDGRAEFGYMKSIEDEFQELADESIAGTVTALAAEQKEKIDAFFALWRMRADHKGADAGPIKFKSVTGANWTKDQEEQFEKASVSFFRQDGTMPARVVHGLRIQRAIDDYISGLSNIQWGIIHALEGHLIVPDYPAYTIIPLTPTLCLCSGGQTGAMTRQNLVEMNSCFKSASRESFFAQDLTQCP